MFENKVALITYLMLDFDNRDTYTISKTVYLLRFQMIHDSYSQRKEDENMRLSSQ